MQGKKIQIAEVLILPSAIGKVARVFVYEEQRTTAVYHRNSPSNHISIISKDTELPIQWQKQKAKQNKNKQKNYTWALVYRRQVKLWGQIPKLKGSKYAE